MRFWPVAALAVPLLGLSEWLAHQWCAHAAPTPSEYANLRPVVERLHEPSSLIVVVPGWAEPWVRQVLGEELLPLNVLARADDDDFPRALEISLLGQRAPSLASWRLRATHRHDPFTIRVLENPRPAVALARVLDRIEPPFLQVSAGEAPVVPCPYTEQADVIAGGLGGEPTLPERRYQCSPEGIYGVAVTTIDDPEFRPRRCVWAHPVPEGPLLLRFSDFPLGQRLVGHAGFPWLISRDGVGTPVRLRARFAGQDIGAVTAQDTDGWIRFEWPTPGLSGKKGQLELVVDTEIVSERRFCFTLESR